MKHKQAPRDSRNLIIAALVSMLILIGYDYYQVKNQPQQPAVQTQTTQEAAEALPGAPERPKGFSGAARDIATAGKYAETVNLSSDVLSGRVALKGGRIDKLFFPKFYDTLETKNPVQIFSPSGKVVEFFEAGWLGDGTPAPDGNTEWQTDVDALTPNMPATLTWENKDGVVFQRTYILNENDYTIRVVDGVTNNGNTPVRLSHYAQLHESGKENGDRSFYNFFGAEAYFDDNRTRVKYGDLQEDGPVTRTVRNGWAGISDEYFLAAIVPDQSVEKQLTIRHSPVGQKNFYTVSLQGPSVKVMPGEYVENSYRVYTGPKRYERLEAVGADLEKVVNFGWYHAIAKIFFDGLIYFNNMVGNMGVAIILVTLLIKLALFPLANKSYRAMSEMKKLQPKMEQLRERYGDDRERFAQEMMALYRHHKVNPMSGCWPMLIQIPIFFAFYKVILISFEFRHEPFMFWIQDLSTRDPYFVLPILMGLTMVIQQKLNPPAADPMQQKILKFLPVMFTFLFLMFPAGLVLYWTTNSILSVSQQYWIMRRMGVNA